jgi:hypothetical protein
MFLFSYLVNIGSFFKTMPIEYYLQVALELARLLPNSKSSLKAKNITIMEIVNHSIWKTRRAIVINAVVNAINQIHLFCERLRLNKLFIS